MNGSSVVSSRLGYMPLTRRSLPLAPWYVRWMGSANNRWNTAFVEAALEARGQAEVQRHWDRCLPDTYRWHQAIAMIGSEIGWRRPFFFAPEDECFVVLKLWWHGVADCWERERVLWGVGKVFGTSIPPKALSLLPAITLREFLLMLTCAQHEKSEKDRHNPDDGPRWP